MGSAVSVLQRVEVRSVMETWSFRQFTVAVLYFFDRFGVAAA
jgi:hypothetical protein